MFRSFTYTLVLFVEDLWCSELRCTFLTQTKPNAVPYFYVSVSSCWLLFLVFFGTKIVKNLDSNTAAKQHFEQQNHSMSQLKFPKVISIDFENIYWNHHSLLCLGVIHGQWAFPRNLFRLFSATINAANFLSFAFKSATTVMAAVGVFCHHCHWWHEQLDLARGQKWAKKKTLGQRLNVDNRNFRQQVMAGDNSASTLSGIVWHSLTFLDIHLWSLFLGNFWQTCCQLTSYLKIQVFSSPNNFDSHGTETVQEA